MNETTSYPYETRLNIHYQQGEAIDERALADACATWHKHDDDDELFYVVEGKLPIKPARPHGRTRATTVELTKYLYLGGVPAHHGTLLSMA